MAFIDKKDPVVLNIKLTTKGRELLSTGNLTFKYYAIGDSEIDYGFIKEVQSINSDFSPFNSTILRPADNNPKIISFISRNLNGDPYNPVAVSTSPYQVKNSVDSIGFFTNITEETFTFITDSNHVKQPDIKINSNTITGGTKLYLKQTSKYGTSVEEPKIGDLIMVKFTVDGDTTNYITDRNNPTPFLIYKIDSVSGSLASDNMVVTVDRTIPNFSNLTPTGVCGAVVYYNFIKFSGDTIFNDYSTDYLDESVLSFFQNSQSPTVIFPFWNMSIIYTENIAGIQAADRNFTQYNSIAYGSFVSYIQSQMPIRKKLGVIHYTNSSPANVYAEGFYLQTPKLEIPTIMWHKSTKRKLGATFIAGAGHMLVDLGIHYYDLVDKDTPDIIVGKIFDELKMFIIEDPELLFAMSYKSNRSWTLPNFTLGGAGSTIAPPTPPPIVLFVQTKTGNAGIGTLTGVGGENINGYDVLSEYGIEYKVSTAPTWTKYSQTTPLTVNSFNMNLIGLSEGTTYQYRAYVQMGTNVVYGQPFSLTTAVTPPPPPPPPPVIIPSVSTIKGTPAIAQIQATGGQSIDDNVKIAIEKYGMQYRQQGTSTWINSPAAGLAGPLSTNSFSLNMTGLAESTVYEYRAYIQVAGVTYPSTTVQTDTTAATPAPVYYIPEATTGIIFKQLQATDGSIDVITKNNYVTSNGGTAITEYGLLYTQDPTYSSAEALQYGKTGVSKVSIVGNYPDMTLPTTFTIDALVDSAPIYFRMFAVNSVGVGYGSIVNGTTIVYQAPVANTISFGSVCQTSTNTAVTSVITAKLSLSTPLQAGQSINLYYRNLAISDTITGDNSELPWRICADAYYTCGYGTTAYSCAHTEIPYSCADSQSSGTDGYITITSSNYDSICFHVNAMSASKNVALQYTNCATICLSDIQNIGGANYVIAGSRLTASNKGGSGGSTGGLVYAIE